MIYTVSQLGHNSNLTHHTSICFGSIGHVLFKCVFKTRVFSISKSIHAVLECSKKPSDKNILYDTLHVIYNNSVSICR